jgi:hypothetical protein
LRLCLNILLFTLLLSPLLRAQTSTFKEKNHWGIKDKEGIIIAPVFDTIFNFDETGKVCLACFKLKSASANKIIKTSTITFACNYINNKGQKLRVKDGNNDTCSVFSLSKNTVKQLNDNPVSFAVAVKNRRHLVTKDFKQLTFNGYFDISPSIDPAFYNIQQMDESEIVMAGLVDINEKEIIPCRYSHIRINPVDSLIMCCTAGVRDGSEDDIFDYSGKKVNSHRRHIEMATKNFMIQKVFEPKEHYVIYNIKTKEEKNLQANEVVFFDHDQILIRIKDDWYVYDLITNQKKAKQY